MVVGERWGDACLAPHALFSSPAANLWCPSVPVPLVAAGVLRELNLYLLNMICHPLA